MRKRVYAILVEHFKNWGITHVFGIPGKSISPLMLELENNDIRYVLGRHETGSGYAASGYALLQKNIGVVIGTSGPGGTNMITAAAQAKEFQIPVLFITGHPSVRENGRAQSQESSQFGADLAKMFEPVTLFSARIDRADQLRLYLQHALEKAWIGQKGPVHLCIPFDVLMEEVESFYLPLPKHISPLISPDIEQAIQLLHEAKKPVLFVGKGAIISEVCLEIQTIAEHWQIPVVTTPGGKGCFPTHHPLNLGGYGLGGSIQTSEYLKSGIDLMIVIGSQLCDMQLSGFTEDMHPQKVLHFDYDLTFVGKSIPVPTEVIFGDVSNNLKQLIQKSGAKPRTDMIVSSPEISLPTTSIKSPLTAGDAFQALRAVLPAESILFGDAGSHSFYAVQHFDILQPGTFYFDEVFISMGAAIGYSIGAKIACQDRPIVCVTGDGCMMMYGTELSTAVNERLPLIFFVLNNGRLDMVDKGMSYNTGRSVGAVYDIPMDVTKFAESFGAKGFRCHTTQDIQTAIRQALELTDSPSVLEVMVDPNEIPPILTRLLELD